MKKHFFMAAVATMLLTSCGSDTNGDLSKKVEYYPVQLEKDAHWSMIDSDGNLLYEDEFKKQPTAVVEGMFAVREGDTYTLYAAEAKPKAVLEDLKSVSCISEGLIGVVPQHDRIQFVDKKGNVKFVLNPIDKKEITFTAPIFNDGLLIICDEDNKYGAVDTKGNIVIKPHYDDLSFFNEGVAVAGVKDDEGEMTYRIINKKGEDVAKIKKDITFSNEVCQYGRFPARQGDDDDMRCGFIDKKGEFTKLPAKVRRIVEYNDKYIIFSDSDYNRGVMTYDGEIIIRPKYDTITMFGDKFLARHDDSKYDILDCKGDKVQSLDYSSVNVLSGKGFDLIAKDGSTYMLIDQNGKQVGKHDFVDYNADPIVSYSLMSDYFPTQNVVNQIADIITPNSIGDYTLGSTPKTAFKDESAEEYTYRSNVSIYNDPFDSKYFSGSYSLNFSEYVAYSRYEYNPYSYYGSYTYSWNSDSHLKSIKLQISTSNGDWKSFSNAMVKALEEKGFKVEEQDTDEITLTSGSSSLVISKIGETYYSIELSTGKIVITEDIPEEAYEVVEEPYDEFEEAAVAI